MNVIYHNVCFMAKRKYLLAPYRRQANTGHYDCRKEGGEDLFKLAAVCNLTASCYKIVHTGLFYQSIILITII